MKAPVIVALVAATVAGLGGVVWWSRDEATATTAAVPVAPASAVAPTQSSGVRSASSPLVAATAASAPARDVAIPAVIDQSLPAEQSMAAAREHGDPRAPVINRVKETDEPPTPEELADPKKYQAYERRQTLKGYSSYVKAVDSQLPREQAAFDAAKARGLTPDQIALGEEKIRRMQAARDQLLAEHPELRTVQ